MPGRCTFLPKDQGNAEAGLAVFAQREGALEQSLGWDGMALEGHQGSGVASVEPCQRVPGHVSGPLISASPLRPFWVWATGLICLGCHNKRPQTGQLKPEI